MRVLSLLAVAALAACGGIDGPAAPTDPGLNPDLVPGEATGRVLSKEYGVMGGIRVTAIPGGQVATTASDGQFTMNGLTPGALTFRLAALPAGCAVPEDRPADLNAGGTIRLRFLVDCSGSGVQAPK
jgi:hypothetical protein